MTYISKDEMIGHLAQQWNLTPDAISHHSLTHWMKAGVLTGSGDQYRRIDRQVFETWAAGVEPYSYEKVLDWPAEHIYLFSLKAARLEAIVGWNQEGLPPGYHVDLPTETLVSVLQGPWRLAPVTAQVLEAGTSWFYGSLKGLSHPELVRPIQGVEQVDSDRYRLTLGEPVDEPLPDWFYLKPPRGPAHYRIK